ncbi:MAG TPA: molybdopterin molybdotransferase MoeA [Aquimonas sp.]|nr:molybdopterin molybdotransferase MoeA [Aquimonas sp.]
MQTMIAFHEALRLVKEAGNARIASTERIPLARASGRVLATDVHAPLPLPPHRNSSVDGFAIRWDDVAASTPCSLRVLGEQFAGCSASFVAQPGTCVLVTTGAGVPEGYDTVVMREQAERVGEHVTILRAPSRQGEYVRCVGEDARQGELLLSAGSTLDAARIGVAAACGLDRIAVFTRPTVAVFTLGDELRQPGEHLEPGQIYDSNRPMLQALLAECGIESVSWPALPDDPNRLRAALMDAAEVFDLILTCGGVSAGDKDFLPTLLRESGRPIFWKVRMKPGMPVLFGELGRSLYLGLPGNPVSVLATFRQLARPLLDSLQVRRDGAQPLRAKLTEAVIRQAGRREYRRGALGVDENGQLWVKPNPIDGSHRLVAAAVSNALWVMDEHEAELQAGDVVSVEAFASIDRWGNTP